MKAGIHPNYRDVCFQDMSNGFKFVTRSCANAKEMIKMEDGRDRIPSTPVHRSLWTTWVDVLSASATVSARPQLSNPASGCWPETQKSSPVIRAAFFSYLSLTS
jgi:ribosomal protein L31